MSTPEIHSNKFFDNEPLFERCPHDRQNPYVMISREMAQDKSISPKARGVLLYILSLPSDWKIYHSQLRHGLGVGEEYLNSAIDELLANGYADRKRERINGMYQPYTYKIREFKKCSPNGENQPGFSGPENPVLQSKEATLTKEEQQQRARAAAVLSDSSEKKQEQSYDKIVQPEKPKSSGNPRQLKPEKPLPDDQKVPKDNKPLVYDFLEKIGIDQLEKIKLTRDYDYDTVKRALEFTISNENKIKTSFIAYFKMSCQNGLSVSSREKKFTDYEKIQIYFKNGEVYNGATCWVSEKAISFERGMKHEQLELNKYFKWENLIVLCKGFGINLTPY